MSERKTTINRKEIQSPRGKRPVSKLASGERKGATPRRGVAAKRTTPKPVGATAETMTRIDGAEIGRTTRKAPRAAAPRTSRRPSKKKGAGAAVTPKRSAKKRASKKRSASGRAKRK